MVNLALNQLAQLVYDYCGLNYLSNLSYLEMKVSKRLTQLKISSYWEYIIYLEDNRLEWECLVEVLTINETYFYREDKQLNVYQKQILPALLNNAKHQKLKIWSAGCSTGEEPYSLAIMTMETGLCGFDDIEIIGTDINKKVLEIATKGVYNKKSLAFRRVPEMWLTHYFDEGTNHYSVSSEVKRYVLFDYFNLIAGIEYDQYEQYDVIFCRNVLIYFDEETIKKVVTSFYHALKRGGYLFLGHAETIIKLDIGFETINTNETFYYRKG